MPAAQDGGEEISDQTANRLSRLTAQLERDKTELLSQFRELDEESLAEGRDAATAALEAARRLARVLDTGALDKR
jgi:hypothetical protein